MSFKVFAAGVPDFHFVRDNNPDDDVFDTADVLNTLNALGPSRLEVGLAIEETLAPNNIFSALSALATQECLHLMKSAVGFLALRKKARQGWIAVNTYESNFFWVDTARNSQYKFSPGADPGTEFFKAIKDDLIDTDLANWGVLRMIAVVLLKYKDHISDNDRVMLSIEISH